MGLFSKKKDEEETLEEPKDARDRVIFEQLLNDDERAVELIEELKKGNPLIINFEKLDLMAANKMLAFLAGATVALDGNTVKINKNNYLFARKEDFLDGTLKELLAEI